MSAVSKSRCIATRTAAPAAATWSPALQARGVGALPRLDGHVEVAGGVGDLAEQRQVGGARRPSASASMRRSNASCQSPRAAAARARSTRPDQRHRSSRASDPWPIVARVPAPTVTVRVTAVTVLLTPLG